MPNFHEFVPKVVPECAQRVRYLRGMNANNEPDFPTDLIGTQRAGDLLGVDRNTVRVWVNAGKLRGWNVLGRIRVSRADVLALLTPVVPAGPKVPRRATRTRKSSLEILRKAGVEVPGG